ncbi:protease modulator HflC [Alkaliphilus serpentinus]|uniref:Protein HflC n=1 Tax=Alkaliphilus serpentinus TaxID=1482731 RepID=A0A833HQF7_9FIRM|nr:protease modulator HflC [Alkaliphilus serpentinus]KAB3531797.1 protease modulator HflC [Alkaliphilus serpentinus]
MFRRVTNIAEEFNSQATKPKFEFPKKTFITILIIFFALIFVFNNLYIVQPNEYRVVRQFGEIVKIVAEPGLHFKIPFIQSTTSLPKHTLIYDVPAAEINTLDKKRIMVDYYGMWRITDPKAMIETLRTVGAAETRLGDIIYSNIRTELGKMDYEQIVNSKKNRRGDIDSLVKEEVNAILAENLNGVELVDIKMKRTDLPPANEQSVFQRMISERESTAQQYLSQGDAEALKIQAETDRTVEEMLAMADAEAKTIAAEGEKEAARIYNEAYGKDPEFFHMYRTLESYKTVIGDETVIVLPIDSPYLKYLLGQ